jgi:hypothetical protein
LWLLLLLQKLENCPTSSTALPPLVEIFEDWMK